MVYLYDGIRSMQRVAPRRIPEDRVIAWNLSDDDDDFFAGPNLIPLVNLNLADESHPRPTAGSSTPMGRCEDAFKKHPAIDVWYREVGTILVDDLESQLRQLQDATR